MAARLSFATEALVLRIHEGIRPRHYATIDLERKPLELPGAERFEIRIDL